MSSHDDFRLDELRPQQHVKSWRDELVEHLDAMAGRARYEPVNIDAAPMGWWGK